MSKDGVSAMWRALDEQVAAFRQRPAEHPATAFDIHLGDCTTPKTPRLPRAKRSCLCITPVAGTAAATSGL